MLYSGANFQLEESEKFSGKKMNLEIFSATRKYSFVFRMPITLNGQFLTFSIPMREFNTVNKDAFT